MNDDRDYLKERQDEVKDKIGLVLTMDVDRYLDYNMNEGFKLIQEALKKSTLF